MRRSPREYVDCDRLVKSGPRNCFYVIRQGNLREERGESKGHCSIGFFLLNAIRSVGGIEVLMKGESSERWFFRRDAVGI